MRLADARCMVEMERRSSITLGKEEGREGGREGRLGGWMSSKRRKALGKRGREGGREGRMDSLVVGVGGDDDEAVSAPDLLQDADEHLAIRKAREGGREGGEGEKIWSYHYFWELKEGGREGGRARTA